MRREPSAAGEDGPRTYLARYKLRNIECLIRIRKVMVGPGSGSGEKDSAITLTVNGTR